MMQDWLVCFAHTGSTTAVPVASLQLSASLGPAHISVLAYIEASRMKLGQWYTCNNGLPVFN